MEFEPIAPAAPVAVRIAKQILGRIREGALPLGAQLPSELELARQFAVSRPTIREALGALQFAGYVESGRGSRKRVIAVEPDASLITGASAAALPNSDSIVSLLEARLIVEPQVVALAALSPVDVSFERATILVQGMGVAAAGPGLLAITDLSVHRAIIEICPNPLLVSIALSLLDLAEDPALHQSRRRAWADAELPSVWAAHHEEVLRAIKAGDANAASLASRAHLISVVENFRAASDHDEQEIHPRSPADERLATLSALVAFLA